MSKRGGMLSGFSGTMRFINSMAKMNRQLERINRQTQKAAQAQQKARKRATAKPRIKLPPLKDEHFIPADLRRAVLQRDGHACRRCGARTNLELHHDVPVANGGATSGHNLRTLCQRCHRQGEHSKREVRTAPRPSTYTGPRPTYKAPRPSTNTAPRMPPHLSFEDESHSGLKSELGLWVTDNGVIRGPPAPVQLPLVQKPPVQNPLQKKSLWDRLRGR
jgi:5-methylcytosine-specific restriction endonuclease McrA